MCNWLAKILFLISDFGFSISELKNLEQATISIQNKSEMEHPKRRSPLEHIKINNSEKSEIKNYF
jgi:hypothetical protein